MFRCASPIPASQTRWPDKKRKENKEEESTPEMKEMKREGEKSREVLLVITVISKSFSERLDRSLFKSSPLTGKPQEDFSAKRNQGAIAMREKKSEKGGREGRWITVTYIHRMKEFCDRRAWQ